MQLEAINYIHTQVLNDIIYKKEKLLRAERINRCAQDDETSERGKENAYE